MPTARLYQRPKNAMSSGHRGNDGWMLEFEPGEAKRPDPLTGWAGSGDTLDQIHLRFPTRDAAIAHCEREGWDYVLVPTPPKRLKLQAYADNFK